MARKSLIVKAKRKPKFRVNSITLFPDATVDVICMVYHAVQF